jgi:hypothetical protein
MPMVEKLIRAGADINVRYEVRYTCRSQHIHER